MIIYRLVLARSTLMVSPRSCTLGFVPKKKKKTINRQMNFAKIKNFDIVTF